MASLPYCISNHCSCFISLRFPSSTSPFFSPQRHLETVSIYRHLCLFLHPPVKAQMAPSLSCQIMLSLFISTCERECVYCCVSSFSARVIVESISIIKEVRETVNTRFKTYQTRQRVKRSAEWCRNAPVTWDGLPTFFSHPVLAVL